MLLKEIVSELITRGYECRIVETNENGVEKRGIMMSSVNGVTYPMLLVDGLIRDIILGKVSFNEAIESIIDRYEKDKYCEVSDYISDPQWVFAHVQIAMQRIIDEKDVIKKPSEKFEGLEEYLIVIYDNEKTTTSFKVKYEYAKMLDINVNELWSAAYSNTLNKSQMKPVGIMIKDLLDESDIDEDDIDDLDDALTLHVVTNNIRYKGSAAILNEELLKNLCRKFKCKKLVCLPSSIHEWLIYPLTDKDDNIDAFHEMVHEVNRLVLKEEEVLADHAFLFEF